MSFSVVIPLFNRAHSIRSALNSVLVQTLEPREIVVIDDGSTDEGASLVRQLYPQVKVYSQANSGPGPARNYGILRSDSTWIAFLDSDDVWRPNHLEELARIVRECPGIGLACTKYEVVEGCLDEDLMPSPEGDVKLIDYFIANAPAFTSSTAVRREAVQRLGGFLDRVPGQDKELWARIACHYPVGTSTASTSVYRIGTGGISETVGRRVKPTPRCIEDVSITLATVSDALQDGVSTVASRESLRLFLNSRLEAKLKQKLLEGDVEYARALRQFVARPAGIRCRAIFAATRAPEPLIRLGMGAVRRRIDESSDLSGSAPG